MSQPTYATAPVATSGMPPGVPYIIGNEAAERFSFYGMKGILVVFMTKYLLDAQGESSPMSPEQAKSAYHFFSSSAYFFPIFGAILADVVWGKYRTIILLSMVYCLGHVALSLDHTRLGLFIGLGMIAMGSGGIKPCVSAHVGDQFGHSNRHLLERVFGWFYFSINFGSAISTMLTPWLLRRDGFTAFLEQRFTAEQLAWLGPLDRLGPHVAFGVPGVLMFLATFVFWLGRNKFVHIPPKGKEALRVAFSQDGLRTILRLLPIFAFVAVFWSLYDQSGSAWVLQAGAMDRVLLRGTSWEFEIDPSQVHSINPILIMIFMPLFAYVIYPALERVFPLTPLRKISIGLFLMTGSFVVSALIEDVIVAGGKPHIYWQLLAYVILTAAEVMVSIVCLEFSYTQAPKEMKSFIMSLYLLSISAGNLFTAVVNYFLIGPDGKSRISGPMYYWLFAGLMLLASIGFVWIAKHYKEHTYLQDEQPTA